MRFIYIAAAFLCLLLNFTAAFGQTGTQNRPGEFAATDINGESYKLSGDKGKVVLLSFWSTRCPICQAEIPNLNRLSRKYAGKDVVFIALTTENEARVNAFLEKNPFDFRIIPNSFGVLLKYADRDQKGNINMGFPAHYLINQNGEIVLKVSGWDKTQSLDAQINRLLQ